MKKFLIALAVVSLSVSQAFGGGCCFNQGGYSRGLECEAPCSEPAEPVIPNCTTTRQVPYTAYRTEVVHVAPIREEVPVAPLLKRVPQPDLVVRHKQAPIYRPDLICRTKQPCKFVCEEQPTKVRYFCPIGSTNQGCAAPCA